jgi:hypothetical protein
MPVVKKAFTVGINNDDASYLMDPKEYLGALNIRFVTSENGEVGQITNIEGNQLKNQTIDRVGATTTFTLPQYGWNKTIGAYEDYAKRRLFWFNYNSTGWHGIYCYDADTDKIYTLLENTNNDNLIYFYPDKFIHSVAMIGDLMYWIENGLQKKINVEAAIKANHPSYSTSVERYELFNPLITTPGSGYTNGVYVDVPVSNTTPPNPAHVGIGARATVTVAGGVVTKVVMTYFGRYYRNGDTFTFNSAVIGGTGSGVVVTINGLLAKSVLTVIRWKPVFPATATAQVELGLINNFIDNDAYQFTYRYVYRDGEKSVFAPLSNMIPYDLDGGSINCIDVKHPNRPIEQDVTSVEFAVKFMTGGKMFIIKTFNKSDIATHNSGSYLTYRFYNDTAGAAVAPAEYSKPYDYVPVSSETLEIAKNRLFLGNNVYGYNDPNTTSLSAKAIPIVYNKVTGVWMELEYLKLGVVFKGYYVGIAYEGGYKYFYPDTQPIPPAFPSTLNFINDLNLFSPTIDFTTPEQIATFEGGTLLTFKYTGYYADVTNLPVIPPVTAAGAGGINFKSNAYYRLGIVFYDKYGRSGGVIGNEPAKAITADTAYSNFTYNRDIIWSLSQTNALTEIPDWAWYYSIVRTKCLTVSSFMQWRDDFKYVIKDPVTGNLTYQDTHSVGAYGIGILSKNLAALGMGYTYDVDEEAVVRVYKSDGTKFTLKVKDQSGDYIIIEPADIGSSAVVPDPLYELSIPYVLSEQEFYYEVGNMYEVANPTSNFRSYSKTYGFLSGDVYIKLITPGTYFTENMSLNKRYWQNWYTGIGMANAITSATQSPRPVSISYSGTYLPGTKLNGLSSFEALDFVDLPTELHSIQKLIITSKIQFEGNVMLAIGEQGTANIYVGETQLFDNTGSSFIAKSSGVIGNINILRGAFGTINPESAFRWSGEVIYFDANRGAWVKYDMNGLSAISDNKMRKFFKKSGIAILENKQDPSVYNAINTNLPVRVLGMVDPFHEEYLVAMPRMGVVPENAVLSDVEIETYGYIFTMANAVITAVPDNLSGFTYEFGAGPSTSQSFTLTASDLSPNGNLTITAPAGFSVGTTALANSSSITVPYTGTGLLSTNTIYVRMVGGLPVSTPSGTLTIVGGGGSESVSLSGAVTAPVGATLTATPSSTSILNYVDSAGPSTAVQIQLTGFNLSPASGNITIPASTNIEVSTTSATTGFSTAGATIPYAGGALASTNIWIRLKAGLAIGSYSENIVLTGGGASATITGSGVVSDWDIITLVPAGLGNTTNQACTTASMYDIITPYNGNPFGPGTVLFFSGAPPTPVTGYVYVNANGSLWNLDPLTGTVLSLSQIQC